MSLEYGGGRGGCGGGGLRFVRVGFVQHLVQEVDVSRSQLKRLDFGQLVGRQRGYDLTKGRERLVQALRPLPFPDVGHHSLTLGLLGCLR